MKKLLLSCAFLALAASLSAESYTLIDADNRGNWETVTNGFTCNITAGGKSFTIKYDKGSYSNDLKAPNDAGTQSWRMYKGTNVTIDSPDMVMKQVVITYDDYTYDGKGYASELDLSSGWSGTLDGLVYTIKSAGSNTITMTASQYQVRIVKIVVSDTSEGGDEPVGPDTPDTPDQPVANVINESPFSSSLDGWKVTNDPADLIGGWSIDSKYECAKVSTYANDVNYAGVSKLTHTFDLSEYTDVNMSFEAKYGFLLPTTSDDHYRIYVKCDDEVRYLYMANVPTELSGNWSADWLTNSFDLSEYDGEIITIGFEYNNYAPESMIWEVRNFLLYSTSTGSVVGIEDDLDGDIAPAYYNLQGVRVDNPEKGIYIEVRGNKVRKILK